MAKSKMMYMKSKIITPKANTGFVNLTEPDKMSGKYGAEFKITAGDKSWKATLKTLLDFENQCRKEAGLTMTKTLSVLKTRDERTVKREDGTEVTYDGYQYIKAKRRPDKGQVPVVDAANKEVDASLVWMNSVARGNFTVAFTNSHMYTGLVLYLDGVQLLETAATPGGGGAGFDVDEDYAPISGGEYKGSLDDAFPFDDED